MLSVVLKIKSACLILGSINRLPLLKMDDNQVNKINNNNMRVTKSFLILAILCAVALRAWAQSNWDEVYAMTYTTAEKWTQLNAGSTTGKTLGAANTTTYYYANSNLSFTNSTAGGSGLTIQGIVYLYLPEGVTITCKGADAGQPTGAGAGIELSGGNALYLIGQGAVNATGGNAAGGANGANGSDAGYDNSNYWSGSGGNGGNGGGGAGAGIGSRGGDGGCVKILAHPFCGLWVIGCFLYNML